MSESMGSIDFVGELQALLQDGEEEALRIFLKLVRPEDIAEWLDHLSSDDRQQLVDALDDNAAGTVLSDTTTSIRSELVDDIDPVRLARIAEAMPADDAADLIGELEEEDSEKVLHHIADSEEEILRNLLRYPEDTAGGIMNPHVVALTAEATVDDAITFLRGADDDTVTAALYVVDEDCSLSGFVRLRRLVTASARAHLGDIMSSDVISIPADADQQDVADMVDKYDFVALPVVDEHNRLLGAVTIDDVLNVIEEEDLATFFEIEHTPTLMLYRDGLLLMKKAAQYTEEELAGIVQQAESLDMDLVKADLAEESAAGDD